MKCRHCGSTNLKVVESGPHQKLVCGDCLKFQKFLSKAEAKTFLQLQKPVQSKLAQLTEIVKQQQKVLADAERQLVNEQYHLVSEALLKAERAIPKMYHLDIGDWDCPTSPIGVCVYDTSEDPACDECLFCGIPNERT